MPKPGWGVSVLGEPADLEDWTLSFKEPFEPWIERHGDETVLRSASFDELGSASEVRDHAVALIERLNGVVALYNQTGQLRLDGVIKFTRDGKLHRTILGEMGVFELRDRMRASAVVIGSDGKPAPFQPPKPSQEQKWTALAENDDLLDDALIYFGRATDWFDIYKALECLILRFGGTEKAFLALGWASAAEISRLRRTANSARHAKRKFDPPPNPISLKDARTLLGQLLRCGLREAEQNTSTGTSGYPNDYGDGPKVKR